MTLHGMEMPSDFAEHHLIISVLWSSTCRSVPMRLPQRSPRPINFLFGCHKWRGSAVLRVSGCSRPDQTDQPTIAMNPKNLIQILARPTLAISTAAMMASCSSFEHPVTRHDMDGDGLISHGEYQQNHMQYNMANRQRWDEMDRARQVTRHISNAGDMISGVNRGLSLLNNFGR